MDKNNKNNQRPKRSNWFTWQSSALALITLIAGLEFGFYYNHLRANNSITSPKFQQCIRLNGYQLTNPLLYCDSSFQGDAAELASLRNKLELYTYDLVNVPAQQYISVYFRDPGTGEWLGINENQTYDPASLLKLPLAIAYYKEAENNPTLFSKKLLYPGEPENGKNIDFYTLTPGQRYTVKDLIDAMITKSDNGAKDLLFANLDLKRQNQIFSDLGIKVPDNPNSPYVISAKTYITFFRVLYNATYLNRTDSEDLLTLLSQSQESDGLVAGVPSGTTVAHKFGQYGTADPNSIYGGQWEFHDCGIIYYPNNPYHLCVMTKGPDLNALKKTVGEISKIVYQEVGSAYGK